MFLSQRRCDRHRDHCRRALTRIDNDRAMYIKVAKRVEKTRTNNTVRNLCRRIGLQIYDNCAAIYSYFHFTCRECRDANVDLFLHKDANVHIKFKRKTKLPFVFCNRRREYLEIFFNLTWRKENDRNVRGNSCFADWSHWRLAWLTRESSLPSLPYRRLFTSSLSEHEQT